MLLSGDTQNKNPQHYKHPYWYARVLKIFHVFVQDCDQPSKGVQRMDVLWVRWFGEPDANEWEGGWQSKRLLRIGFVPGPDDGFGFVDPHEVIRGCYLSPVREFLMIRSLLDPPSSLASDSETAGDYPTYDIVQ
jgi:hypothetical protein